MRLRNERYDRQLENSVCAAATREREQLYTDISMLRPMRRLTSELWQSETGVRTFTEASSGYPYGVSGTPGSRCLESAARKMAVRSELHGR